MKNLMRFILSNLLLKNLVLFILLSLLLLDFGCDKIFTEEKQTNNDDSRRTRIIMPHKEDKPAPIQIPADVRYTGHVYTIKPSDLSAITASGITVVEFSKDICPPCDWQVDVLNKLSKDYPTIKFVKVKAYNALIQPTDKMMVKKFNLKWTPTTVLIVDGHKVYEWVTFHGKNSFVEVLDKAVSGKFVCTPDGCMIIDE